MASTKQICLLTIVVLFAVFEIANGLNCITCTNPTCQQTESRLCTGHNDQCLKIENGGGDVIRDKKCGTIYECETYVNCYHCKNENDCNSSSTIMPCFLVIGIAGMILTKYYI